MIPGLAAAARNHLEIQILWPHARPTDLEIPKVRPIDKLSSDSDSKV